MPNFDAAIFKISIHALREEGDDELQRYVREQAISIHALREEGDLRCAASKGGSFSISIHALREEGDSYQPSRSTIP